jgi:hypothetical protein
MHCVREAEYLSEYKVLVTFEDGSSRVADLEIHLNGEIFSSLKALDQFKAFRVEPDLDTLVWPNGADFSPDFLYEISIPLSSAGER